MSWSTRRNWCFGRRDEGRSAADCCIRRLTPCPISPLMFGSLIAGRESRKNCYLHNHLLANYHRHLADADPASSRVLFRSRGGCRRFMIASGAPVPSVGRAIPQLGYIRTFGITGAFVPARVASAVGRRICYVPPSLLTRLPPACLTSGMPRRLSTSDA
jgi:hypothetical protein